MHHAVGFQGAEHRQAFQILGMVDLTANEKAGTGDHQHLRLTQAASDQQRIFVAQFPYAQGHVDAFVHQIDPPVEQHHLQLDLRKAFQKVADHPRQYFMGQPYGAGHPQASAGLAGHAGHGLVGHFRLQQHRLAVPEIALTDGSQLQLSGGALQQTCAKALFQLGDAP
ncbi:hypothetical protein D3C78_1293130 [compost metagenome]